MDKINLEVPSLFFDLILSKLPIPMLHICSLVCKAWNTMILGLNFSSNSKILFPYNSSHQKLLHYWVDFDSKSLNEEKSCIVASFTFHPGFSTIKIVNSCNGLICFVDKKREDGEENMCPFVFVLDLMTNECIKLPPIDYPFMFNPITVSSEFQSFGFGFSPNAKLYKIVRLSVILAPGLFVADIFTFGTFGTNSCGKWSSMPYKPFFVDCRNHGVYLNGSLYWNGYEHTRPDDKNALLRFDVECEKFYEVPFPEGKQDRASLPCSHIWVLNDTLYLSGLDLRSRGFHVWKIEQDSWIKEFSIPPPFVCYNMNTYRLQLINVFDNEKILCLVSGRDLFLYDSNTNKIEALDHKLHGRNEEKLWVYELESFNFDSLSKILGIDA